MYLIVPQHLCHFAPPVGYNKTEGPVEMFNFFRSLLWTNQNISAPEVDLMQKESQKNMTYENEGRNFFCFTANRFFLIRVVAVECNWVHSACRPPIGLLHLPWVIMSMKNLVE
jgi:hypothetical protein